jgi:hypothetical protein
MVRVWRVGGVIKPWHVHRGVPGTWETQCAPEGVGREAVSKGEVIGDVLGAGSFHNGWRVTTEGNDSFVNICVRKPIPDRVELDKI